MVVAASKIYNGAMKTTGRKTVKAGKTSAPRVAKAPAGSDETVRPQPTHEDISRRAYELYLARANGAGGSAADDWLAAERELSA